jgi:nicotinate-nucleotide adenylyltransferase
MGSDSFQNLPKWKNAPLLISDYEFIVYNRPDFVVTNKHEAKVTILNAPLLTISATHVRDNIKAGKSIRYLVPDKVREYIEANKYFK